MKHMPGICPCSVHGTWRLWPLSWVFNTDRAEQCMVAGVNKATGGKYVHCLQPNAQVHTVAHACRGAPTSHPLPPKA